MANQYRRFFICQELQYYSIDKLVDFLNNHQNFKYAYIVHDKDNGAPHFHLYLRTGSAFRFDELAKLMDLPPQYIEKVRNDEKAVDYLTHENDAGKHHYDKSEIHSNFDYENVRNYNSQRRLDEINNGIENGLIREYNYHNFITLEEQQKFSRQIKIAFDRRRDIKQSEVQSRNMQVIYIYGASGTGKSTMARQLCEKKGLSYYCSSSSNDVLDGYKGQDALIIDDARGGDMRLSDLLKLTDNYYGSTVKSRYSNKVLECKLLIITTIVDVDQFYSAVFKEQEEPIKQLKRRCTQKYKLTNDFIYAFAYDDDLGDYALQFKAANTICSAFEHKTDKEKFESCLETISSIGAYVSMNKDEILKQISTDDFNVPDDDDDVPFA